MIYSKRKYNTLDENFTNSLNSEFQKIRFKHNEFDIKAKIRKIL